MFEISLGIFYDKKMTIIQIVIDDSKFNFFCGYSFEIMQTTIGI